METIGDIEKKIISLGFMPLEHSVLPIAKGGSARRFYRFKDAKRGDAVACFYTDERPENLLYGAHAKFLSSCGVCVPEVWFDDARLGALVMSSAGSRDLGSLKNSDDNFIPLYLDALSNIAAMHIRGTRDFEASPVPTMPHFDAALYEWEHSYFLDNCMKGRFGAEAPRALRAELESLKTEMSGMARVLLHRDFQSQNVMLSSPGGREKTVLIDFQGMRLGPCWYDVASLLYDPYVEIAPFQRETLFNFYCAASQSLHGLDRPRAARSLRLAACQRLMQALGAYGFLSMQKGMCEYEKYFPRALANLIMVSEEAGLPALERAAKDCFEKVA